MNDREAAIAEIVDRHVTDDIDGAALGLVAWTALWPTLCAGAHRLLAVPDEGWQAFAFPAVCGAAFLLAAPPCAKAGARAWAWACRA